ncbi:MAG: hypothetical protein H6739_06610 [Alphaproteobacteria bacterium]|nr:hypothetical protein [Alphaproteobacteria bacterium]
MGILNLTNDGLPSVLVVLVRALRAFGPMERDRLQALVAPPALEQVSSTFKNAEQLRQTLNRWTQIGLFIEDEGVVRLAEGYAFGPTQGYPGLRALGTQLRRLVLAQENNADLGQAEPSQAADFTHALCWMLAQDIYAFTEGNYASTIQTRENEQFPELPWAFQNSTRWRGFREWAPLMGFAWVTNVPTQGTLMMDPTPAVEDCLSEAFHGRRELAQAAFFAALARLLPVLDEGAYRQAVEARLREGSWRALGEHEVSPSLSRALLRLEATGRLRLEERSDADHRSLLGQGFRPIRRVSHVLLNEAA